MQFQGPACACEFIRESKSVVLGRLITGLAELDLLAWALGHLAAIPHYSCLHVLSAF